MITKSGGDTRQEKGETNVYVALIFHIDERTFSKMYREEGMGKTGKYKRSQHQKSNELYL